MFVLIGLFVSRLFRLGPLPVTAIVDYHMKPVIVMKVRDIVNILCGQSLVPRVNFEVVDIMN